MGKRDFTQCTQCGICCRLDIARRSGGVLATKPDGSCVHLAPSGACSIYEDRPPVCRADTHKPKRMSWRRYWNLNAALCNSIQERLGYPLRFRVRMRR